MPDEQRKGIARSLLTQLSEDLGKRGVEWLFLEVNAENQPARRLYETLGFSTVGRRPAYYQTHGGRQDALIMRLRPEKN